MHELGITRNIVAIVAEAAAGRRVRRVSLELGKLSGVAAEAVAFCFGAVAQGTVLDGATLAIDEVEGRARCIACGTEFAAATHFTPCPCGSRRTALIKGEELKITTMELEAA